MATLLRTYTSAAAAQAAVEHRLAAGVHGEHINLLTGATTHDHRTDPVGSFAGRRAEPVRDFAGEPHTLVEGHGTFAGDPSRQRVGGFDDTDRETWTTFDGGAAHPHVITHRHACSLLDEFG